MLGAADPSNDGPIDTPDFGKIFRPKTRKQRLKLEDLEEDEDEDFKAEWPTELILFSIVGERVLL